MREYRQNANTRSLVIWAILCAIAAAGLFYHSEKIVSRSLHWAEIAGGAALLLLGPAVFVVYFIRARLVWVSVDRERGIVVSGKRVIPWEEIDAVERRRPRLRKSTGPTSLSDTKGLKDVGKGCDGCGGCGNVGSDIGAFVVVIVLIIVAFFLVWALFFVFVPLVIVPVLEILGPLGDRIRIVGRKGHLLLRDLQDADAFLAELRDKVDVEER